MSMIFVLASTIAFALVLSSCAKEGSVAPAAVAPEAPPAPPPAPPTAEELLRGSWISTVSKPTSFGICQAAGLRVSERETVFTYYNSRESDCSLMDVETNYTMKHVVGSAEPNAIDEQMLPIELKQTAVRVRPVSDLGASLLRIRKWCGIEDWASGRSYDVTAKVEKGEKNCARSLPKNHTFKIEGERMSLSHKIEADRRNNIPASENRLVFMRKK
jgi:hypothetical protein